MPTFLPSSMDPSSVTWTRNRPRSIVQSDFTGFTQQVLSGTTFLSGQMTPRAQVTEQDVRDWQKFFADVENGDGTFWCPVWSVDYDGENVDFVAAGVSSIANRELTVSLSLAGSLMSQIGRSLQVSLQSNTSVSVVFTLVSARVSVASVILKVAEPIPFSSSDQVLINRGHRTLARALLPDPESQTLVMDTVGGSNPATIPWVEAMGDILHDYREAA